MNRIPLLVSIALAFAAPAAARRHDAPPPDLGMLTLDRADPAIDVTVAGVPARIAVSLDARDTMELAPSFSGRPGLAWEDDSYEEVGRIRLPTRMAAAAVGIGGVVAPIKLTTHDKPCCGGHDGEVSPVRLPWSTVRLGTSDVPEERFAGAFDEVSGLTIPMNTPAGTIHLILSPRAPQTLATASAAAILSCLYGERFVGVGRMEPIAYGIQRQVRDMAFDRQVPILGFTVSRIAVRFADFAGARTLPDNRDPDGDEGDGIRVSHRGPPPQHEWAAITIGRDLLDRCPAIAVYRGGAEIGLSCRGGM